MILVSVIGDFYSSVAPVFYHYKDDVTKHIIVTEKKYIQTAFIFDENVKKLEPKSLKKQIVLKLSKVNVKVLENLIKELENEEEIFLNVTDGLSLINTYLSYKLLPLGVKFISYDIFENKIKVFSKDGFWEIEANVMNVEEHLKIKGFDIVSKENKEFFLKHEEELTALFEENLHEFIEFKKAFLETKNIRQSRFSNVARIVKKLGLYDKDYNVLHKTITGGLFEGYVYLKLKDLGFDDIEIGVCVTNDDVTNEFDVLAMKNNHLNIIECKNKPFKNFDLEKLIYKYTTLRERIDYDAKAAIVTLENNYSFGYKKRAKTYNLGLFGIEKGFENKLKNFLGV